MTGRDKRISPDDELYVIGRIGVVVDASQRFRAVFVVTGFGEQMDVISSLNLKNQRRDDAPCKNCSRPGHRTCFNPGVRRYNYNYEWNHRARERARA